MVVGQAQLHVKVSQPPGVNDAEEEHGRGGAPDGNGSTASGGRSVVPVVLAVVEGDPHVDGALVDSRHGQVRSFWWWRTPLKCSAVRDGTPPAAVPNHLVVWSDAGD